MRISMTPSVLNIDVIYSSLGTDPDLGELVEMFVDEMPDRVSTLLGQRHLAMKLAYLSRFQCIV